MNELERFEDIWFDVSSNIYEKTEHRKLMTIHKLFRDGKLVAKRTITTEGTTYKFF